MKKFLLGSVALVALTTTAPVGAADMPVKAAPYVAVWTWTGLYVGGHFGLGLKEITNTAVTANNNFPAGFEFTTGRMSGPVGGVQGGYNYQFSQWVVGIEGEYSWADVKGSETSFSPLLIGRRSTNDFREPWIATIAARLGYAWDKYLVYVKGGEAWSRFKSFSTTFSPANVAIATTEGAETRSGWLVGFGIEHAAWNNWSIKFEGDYIGYGTKSVNRLVLTGNNAGDVNVRNAKLNEFLFKLGVNLKLGG